jgi:hypothetical protein
VEHVGILLYIQSRFLVDPGKPGEVLTFDAAITAPRYPVQSEFDKHLIEAVYMKEARCL